jgi:hypothetical protein
VSDYRCYPVTPSNSIAGPPQIIDCVDDKTAISKARQMLADHPFEVWQGARKVYASNEATGERTSAGDRR